MLNQVAIERLIVHKNKTVLSRIRTPTYECVSIIGQGQSENDLSFSSGIS